MIIQKRLSVMTHIRVVLLLLLFIFTPVPANAMETDLPDFVMPRAGTAEAVASGFYALVANSSDGTVTVFNVANGTVVDTIQVGENPGSGADSSPGCVAVTPDNRWVLVGYERTAAHRLFVLAIDHIADGIANNEIVDIIELGDTNPQEGNCIAVTPDGLRAYVVGGSNGSGIASIDLAAVNDGVDGNEVQWIDRGTAHHDSIAITPDGSRAYFSDYTDALQVLSIEPGSVTDNTVIASVALGDTQTRMKGVAIAPDGRRVYAVDGVFIEKLYVIDSDPSSTTYHTLIDDLPLSPTNDRAHQVAVSPDGHKVYISRDSGVAVVDVDPESPTYLSIAQTLKPREPALWGQGSMALTPDGSTLLTVNMYRDNISIYDTATGAEKYRVPVGNDPRGIALFRQPQIGPHVYVVDGFNTPVAGAEVYRNGELSGISDENGYVAVEAMTKGDELAALLQVHAEPSPRLAHQTIEGEEGWSFRTFVTSLIPPSSTNQEPLPQIADDNEQQILTVNRSSVLILFNLVISIEWDASAGYIAEIASAMQSGSQYLYDASDGQMAIGHVSIFDQAENWREADIQIIAGNFVRPYATVNGIFSDDHADVVNLGRYWDGRSGNAGEWHFPDGFRTIVHELGHYALGMYDEYFRYGTIEPVFCPVHWSALPDDDAGSASIMYYQYQATEFSAFDVPGLWSDSCTATEQWRLNGESTWETLARIYTDAAQELPAAEQWHLITPIERGSALAGPQQLPTVLPDWPTIISPSNHGDLSGSLKLTVLHPDDRPAINAVVTLQKTSGQMIGQGITDQYGRIRVLGTGAGDVVSATIVGTTLEGRQTLNEETEIVMRLQSKVVAAMSDLHPSLQVIPLGASISNSSLLINVDNVSTGTTPIFEITAPGAPIGFTQIVMTPHEDGFAGTASFPDAGTGTGHIRYSLSDDLASDMLHTSYRLQQIDNSQSSEVFSDDGMLSLQLEPGSFAGNSALLAVATVRTLPGSLPTGKEIVGDAYNITATGAVWQLAGDNNADLRLHYDPSLVNESANLQNLAIYRWDFQSKEWQVIGSWYDDEHHALMTTVSTLGTYVLLTEVDEQRTIRLYLPLIQNH